MPCPTSISPTERLVIPSDISEPKKSRCESFADSLKESVNAVIGNGTFSSSHQSGKIPSTVRSAPSYPPKKQCFEPFTAAFASAASLSERKPTNRGVLRASVSRTASLTRVGIPISDIVKIHSAVFQLVQNHISHNVNGTGSNYVCAVRNTFKLTVVCICNAA